MSSPFDNSALAADGGLYKPVKGVEFVLKLVHGLI